MDLAPILRMKAQAKANWKPKFLTKKQREKLEAEKKAAEEAAAAAAPPARPQAARPQAARPQAAQSVPTGPRASRENVESYGAGANVGHDRTNGNDRKRRRDDDEDARRAMEERDEAARREKYLGPPVNQVSKFSAAKKKRRTGPMQFKEDWDPSDNTSRPHDFIYATRRHEISTRRLCQMSLEEVKEEMEILRARCGWVPDLHRNLGEEMADKLHQRWQQAQNIVKSEVKRHAHWSEKSLEAMQARDWRIFKENNAISVKGSVIPNPMRSWEESRLPQQFLDIIQSVGYDAPTPIQKAAIPIAMQARDLIGVAATGSGKTAAFLLPLLVYISKLPPLDAYNKNLGPYALILAPTRELAQQITAEANKFATHFGFNVVSVTGGHSQTQQLNALEHGAEIIVATPGRLVEFIDSRYIVFSQCCYVIMDEADRMIDQGFEESLTKILEAMPASNEKPDTVDAENPQLMGQFLGATHRYRQTMMYTATMPPAVEKIANKYLRRPARVTIGNADEAVDTVEQKVEFVAGEDKRKRRLQELLTSNQFRPPIIVFVNIKRNCDAVAKDIKSMGFSAVALHGGKTQVQRDAALNSLRRGETDVLVATDLAGRGIDVPDVSLVVNFNMATSIESYTHRIGRTGRAGKTGVAITFLGNEDTDVLYDLKQIISKSSRSRVPDELRRHEAAQSKSGRSMRNIEE